MAPMFVSYIGIKDGQESRGFAIYNNCPRLTTAADVSSLVCDLEVEKKYEAGSIILLGFQRLEDPL